MIDLLLAATYGLTRTIAACIILSMLGWLICTHTAGGVMLSLALVVYCLMTKQTRTFHDVRDVADYDGGEDNY